MRARDKTNMGIDVVITPLASYRFPGKDYPVPGVEIKFVILLKLYL